MINTVWESRELDMQLMGKVVLSAAALFLLGLAYRFYKFRVIERSEQSETCGPGVGDTEGDVVDFPQPDHGDDENSNLRLRRVNNNLQDGLDTDPGRKHFASLGAHKVHVTAQERSETADVTCKDQNDHEKLHSNFDPLQSHHYHGDDTTCQKDKRHGEESVVQTQSKHCREDPEGREMLEKSELLKDLSGLIPKNITALSSIDLSLSHQNETKQELHMFSSTAEVQMQENIIAEDGNDFQTVGLRGKIYDYHIESTSQSVTALKTYKSADDSLKSPLSTITLHLPTSEEKKETYIHLKDYVETLEKETKGNISHQGTILQKQYLSNDNHIIGESTDTDGDAQHTRSSSNNSAAFQSGTEEGHSGVEVNTLKSEDSYIKTDIPKNREIKRGEEEETGADDLSNNTTYEVNASQEHDFSSDIKKKQPAESQVSINNRFASANLTTSFSSTVGENIEALNCIQTGPGTYHVTLSPESEFDIHIDLRNCYEVLCLAKKNNIETIKTAAYKLMSDDYLQVLQNSSIYGRLNAAERDLILEARMKGRRFVVVADIDTQATSAAQNMSSLSYYDNDNDMWHMLSQIPAEAVSRGSSMTTMFNYLFVALGCDGPGRQMKPTRRVLCYNPVTDSWKEVSPLNEARPHCKLVALNGFLYAIGGECLHTVERYDPRQNRWSYVTPLPNDTFAVAHMATAYDDEIFVSGGTFRYMLLRYREREKVWKSSLVSGSKDRTTDMVTSNNFLYRFDLNRNMGISVHRCNIRARIWYECATYMMPYPAPFQCAVIDNNIYCISRNFHMRFLAEDISPRFMDTNLQSVPSPKGLLFPLVLVLPEKDTC